MSTQAPATVPMNGVYRFAPSTYTAALLLAALLLVTFGDGLVRMVAVWLGRQEYSHGFLIPLVAAFLVWQQRDRLEREPFSGSWLGLVVVLLGLAVGVVGELATLYTIVQYGFLLTLYGLVLALTGPRVFRLLWMPLLVLLFMIPLPDFILNEFSARMQLLSSQIGVLFIRWCGITVFASGNVIDLGAYKLQVAEACDGLRYLFPLMTLGFILAYFFKAPMWKRVAVFVSSIPVTILLNSFRVGTIGVMVEYWGTDVAEGFLHDFQGWAVFMASAAVLLVEMLLLARVGGDRRAWREVLGVEFPLPTPVDSSRHARALPASLLAAGGLLLVSATAVAALPERIDVVPERKPLSLFPRSIAEWTGRSAVLDEIYVDALLVDDYLVMDYARPGSLPTNLYVAWYDAQRAGQSAHSPRSCIPGGGWQITSIERRPVAGVDVGGQPLAVNRVLIEYDDQRQLVYYWFQQRGRIITNEYAVKWYLFVDSLRLNRTDGALIRLITPLAGDENLADADARLTGLTAAIASQLPEFIPN